MKFCVIGPTYPYRGGIAQHTTLLVQHLRQAGHETRFISFSRQYPKLLYGRDDKDPSQNPLTADALYLIDSINPFTWWQTLRQIQMFQPELVILPWWVPFWTPVWAYLSWGIKQMTPSPHLQFLCHNVLPHERGRFDTAAVRLALGRGDSYVVHAQEQAAILKTIFPQAPILTSPLPTYQKLGSQQQTKPLDLPDDRPLILFCGLIRHYKGLDILLNALSAVLAQRDVHCAVVGEFWEDEAIYRQQIETLAIGDYVTIVNQYVENELLAAYVTQANVVVLPYRSATQSAVVQLAFGLGTPVITTTVGGLPDVVEHGRNGLLVPPEDPAALAQALNQYFAEQHQPKFTANLAAYKQAFSWERLVEKMIKLVADSSATYE